MTIYEMVEAIRSGVLTSRELVLRYISAIDENKHLNAVIEVNPDALDIADRLDATKDKTGLLYGIPILIKDSINTKDRMHTSAGSVALADNIAPEDAPLVKSLRDTGAVILGKANMTEFANYMSESMSNGYSSRGGQTLNFFDHKADPSGSSSGSAVAVIADLCAASIGTETCGSIISPAQCGGIVGIKPTAGLINGLGIFPISFTLDTPGPMTRCVDDARILLSVLTGQQYEKSITKLSGIRIGICRKPAVDNEDITPDWIKANENLIPVMKALGADCVDVPEHGINTDFIYPIMQNEFKAGVNKYLESMHNPLIPQNLQEIIEYNEQHVDIALKYGQDTLVRDNASGALTEPVYIEAMEQREAAIRTLDTFFDANNIDILFSVSSDIALAAATGFPSMTIPLGLQGSGLPIGSFFTARRYNEESLLLITCEIERALL